MRRVLAVLRHPEMAHIFSPDRFQVPPMGPSVLYLKIGTKSFMAYHLRGDVAEAHGCLLSEDRGPHTTEAILEQFRYLFERGVHRIVGVPRTVRAEAKAHSLGMNDTGQMKDGFKVYEVTAP